MPGRPFELCGQLGDRHPCTIAAQDRALGRARAGLTPAHESTTPTALKTNSECLIRFLQPASLVPAARAAAHFARNAV